jgi:hypothetical protein
VGQYSVGGNTAERRMLLEIDSERTTRAEAERTTNRLRDEANEANKQAAARTEAAAEEIGQLKGRLAAAEHIAGKYEERVGSMRLEAAELMGETARWRAEATTAHGRVATLEREVASVRSAKDKSASGRKRPRPAGAT